MIPIRAASRNAISAFMVAVLVFASGSCAKKVEDHPAVAVEKEKGYTVEIKSSGLPNPDPFVCALSKGMKKDVDHVRWHNQSGKEVTLTFTASWPFLEKLEPIVIPDGAYSAYYTLDLSALNTGYPYHIKDVPTDAGHGPDDPSVSAEP